MSRASTSATSTKDGTRRDEIVLRVHLREKVDRDLLSAAELLPTEVDGVPLDVIQASYAPSANGALAANGTLALAGADGALEIEIDPGKARGKVRIAFEPE